MPTPRRLAWLMATVLTLVVSLVVLGCGSGDSEGSVQQPVEQRSSEESTQEELAPVTKVQAERMYAGRVGGTEAFIGIAVRGEQTNDLIAYVCNGSPQGDPDSATIEAWFEGPIEGNEVSLRADGGEEQLRGKLSLEEITGTFEDLDGQTYDFQAESVDPEREAGLYWTKPVEGEGLSSRGGTIILSYDGEQEERGKQTVRIRGKK